MGDRAGGDALLARLRQDRSPLVPRVLAARGARRLPLSEDDPSRYAVVVAPATHVLAKAALDGLADFARSGGRLVVGYQTGILDERLHVHLDGYLGPLRDVLGLRVEEFAPPAEPSITGGSVPGLQIAGLAAGPAEEWGEIVRVERAEVRSVFVGGLLDGLPAITRNAAGDGVAWYVATAPERLGAVVGEVLASAAVEPEASGLPEGVEAVRRGERLFLLNWGDAEAVVAVADRTIPPLGAVVLSRSGASPRPDARLAHSGRSPG